MNWSHFLLWIAGLYGLYYLAVILLDVTAARRRPAGNALTDELTFSEHAPPLRLEHQPEPVPDISTKTGPPGRDNQRRPEPEVIASGGVSLKDMFNLARKDVILYTRSVSY